MTDLLAIDYRKYLPVRLPERRVREPLKPCSFTTGMKNRVPAWLLQPQRSPCLDSEVCLSNLLSIESLSFFAPLQHL